MSDTPRTDASEYESQDEPVAKLGSVDVDFTRQLERELNAANKRLEEIEKSGVYEGRPIDKTYLTIHSDVLSTMVSEKAYDPQATKIRELQDRIKRLEEALEGTVKCYVDLVNSGDAGFWNPEEQSVIIAARAALKKEDNL